MEATTLDAATVKRFLGELDRFEQALAGCDQDGNRELLAALDHRLDRAIVGV